MFYIMCKVTKVAAYQPRISNKMHSYTENTSLLKRLQNQSVDLTTAE